MSQNAEIVRAFIDAVNRGDWDAALKDAAPGFEVDLSRAVGPLHGVYGLDEIRRMWEEFAEAWESTRIDADELIEAGEDVVGSWTLYVRGRDGMEVRSRVTWVVTVREGAIVRCCMFQERREALEAAGLPE